MAKTTPLKLTRDQLAAFLKDPKSIKQFERLFASADATQPETIVEVSYSADLGVASANEALSRVSALEDAVALGERLAQPGSLAATLAAFEQHRYPICKFVQDESRKIGSAGASEDAAHLQQRNAQMQRFAQQGVDRFYEQLSALRQV